MVQVIQYDLILFIIH